MSESDDNPVADPTRYERHRALVRETDREFATVYGVGGAAVLGAAALVLVIGWAAGAIGSALPWVLAVTAALLALFVLRQIVERRRQALASRISEYCEVNQLDTAALVQYFQQEDIYPYFVALLSPRTRPQ